MLVHEKVRNFVEEKRLGGHYRLPPERELASMLNCSRMTISRAMAHLAAEGLVERRQGSGTYILENNRENRTYNIGIGLRSAYHSNDQHFLRMMREVSKNAEPLRLNLQIFDNLKEQFGRNPQRNGLMMSIDSGVLDAMLVITRMPVEIVGALKTRIPLAMINNNAFGYIDMPSVCCDYFQAGFLAAEHLIQNGHRNIGYMYMGDHPEVGMHLSGMRCALKAYQMPPLPDDAVFSFSMNDPDGIQELKHYIQRVKPTALFARNDMIATRGIRCLQQLGYRVPEDISVIGEGNFSWGGQPAVGLTTIDTRIDEVCKRGLELVRNLAHGDKDVPMLTTIQPELVERHSVRRLE